MVLRKVNIKIIRCWSVYIFYEKPDFWTWVGGVIIFISVIYITYRESFKKKGTSKKLQVDRAIIN